MVVLTPTHLSVANHSTDGVCVFYNPERVWAGTLDTLRGGVQSVWWLISEKNSVFATSKFWRAVLLADCSSITSVLGLNSHALVVHFPRPSLSTLYAHPLTKDNP